MFGPSNQRWTLFLSALCALTSVTACGDPEFLDAVKGMKPGELVANSERLAAPLHWGACPPGFATQCAKVKVPVDWLDLSSPTIELQLARRPARQPEHSRGQVWLLDGGPGSNGQLLGPGMDAANPELFADYDVYVLSHRGTLHSGLLNCARAQAPDSPGGPAVLPSEAQDCVSQLGEHLEDYRISHAARDVSHAIRRTRVGGQPVFVYGFSYGTLLAQRLSQIAPWQVSGYILDGLLPSRGISYFDYDLQFDDVAMDLTDRCATDDVCKTKWTGDIWASLRQLKARLEQGHCSELDMQEAQLRGLIAGMVAQPIARTALFALLYRMDRCEAGDVDAIKHYFHALQEEQAEAMKSYDPRSFSPLLFQNIIFSEITGGGVLEIPSLQQVEQACEEALICPGFTLSSRALYDHWPRYAPDRNFAAPADFWAPVLAMSGGLDPQTPIRTARIVAEAFEGDDQQLVEFSESAHGILPFNPTPETPSCASQLVAAFLADPSARVDASCAAQQPRLSFDISESQALAWFGVPDAWENAQRGPNDSYRLDTPDWDAIIELLHRNR